jgi:hypothetical protein
MKQASVIKPVNEFIDQGLDFIFYIPANNGYKVNKFEII